MAITIRTISIPNPIIQACAAYAEANHLTLFKGWFSSFATQAIKEKLQREGFWELPKTPPFPVCSDDNQYSNSIQNNGINNNSIAQNGIDNNAISESSEDSAEILVCPFCGKKPVLVEDGGYSFKCDCGNIILPSLKYKNDAIALWIETCRRIANAKSLDDLKFVLDFQGQGGAQ